MHKSIIFLLGLLIFLILVGSSMNNSNALAFDDYGYEADQYKNYAMDMANNNYYKSQGSDIIKKIKCNNINSNNNGVDVNLGILNGNDALVEAQAADNEGQATTANGVGYGERYKQNDNDFKFVCINNNDNENNVVVVNGTTPEPPIPNPRITVIKEMFICSEPILREAFQDGGFTFFIIFCGPDRFSIPDPDSPVWIPWEECNVAGFCENFSEEDFTMQIEQNPGLNFISYEFPGTNEGRTVNVDSGTYQISEEGNTIAGNCPNPSYEGAVAISNPPPPQPGSDAVFCFILEGDCSDTIEAGEEKTCTVKNYLRVGFFAVPTGGQTASDTNTDTSAFDINTTGGLASSFSSTPTIAQETEDSSALAKIEKLKTQWLDLLP